MSPVKLLYVVAITASLSFLGTGLASAALIGVDWGGAAPTNWNVGTAGANTQNLLNLIDETGAATGINLSYDGAVFSDTILVSFAPQRIADSHALQLASQPWGSTGRCGRDQLHV